MSDALQSLQNLLQGTTSSSLFQRVMGSKEEKEEVVDAVPTKDAVTTKDAAAKPKKPKMRIGFGIPVAQTGQNQGEAPKNTQAVAAQAQAKRSPPVLVVDRVSYGEARLEADRATEANCQAGWKAKAAAQNQVTPKQAEDAYKEWQALVAKQDAIQATLNQMSVDAKKRQTEAKVAELEALERAMAAEAATRRAVVHQATPPEPVVCKTVPEATRDEPPLVLQEDNEGDIPLPSFSSQGAPVFEASNVNVDDDVVTQPILALGGTPAHEPVVEPAHEPVVEPANEPVVEPAHEPVVEPAHEPVVEPANEPVVVDANEPVVEPANEPVVEPAHEPVVVDAHEPVVEPAHEPMVEPAHDPTQDKDTSRAVDLGSVQEQQVPAGTPANGVDTKGDSRTVDLSSANTRSVVAAGVTTLGHTDDTDSARVVHFSDDKQTHGFNYDTMTKEIAKTRWETIDRARGSRVSVAHLKAYCAALGLTFVTPKRDTFAMIKEYFAKAMDS